MVSVKVSEKTLEGLRAVKDKEELKSLDGAIRHILSMIPHMSELKGHGTIFRAGTEYSHIHIRIPIELPIKQKNTSDDTILIEIDDRKLECVIRFLECLKRVCSSNTNDEK